MSLRNFGFYAKLQFRNMIRSFAGDMDIGPQKLQQRPPGDELIFFCPGKEPGNKDGVLHTVAAVAQA